MTISVDDTPIVARERVGELLALYGDPGACVAHLLCDRHPAEAVAYTIVEPDLSRRVLTNGGLKDSSERFASALAALGVGRGVGPLRSQRLLDPRWQRVMFGTRSASAPRNLMTDVCRPPNRKSSETHSMPAPDRAVR